MKTVKLGKGGPTVSRFGLGCMAMSGTYGPPDRAESLSAIRAGLDAGITLIDTGDFYGMGSNEMLIGEAVAGRDRDTFQVSVKFGAMRGPDGAWNGYDARPAAVKNFLAYTLKRLGLDHIDIYRPARLDPNVPIEETVGAIREMIDAGYVRHVGLSEVSPETIRRAVAEAPISDLQIEYSIVSRGIEDAILPVCRELGIGITAYGILSRGMFGGGWKPGSSGARKGDIRARMPRYDAENAERNFLLVEALKTLASEKGITVAQAATAWVAAQGEDIVPLLGPRTLAQLTDSLGAADVTLSSADLAGIEKAVPKDSVAGARYNHAQMAMLDSEKSTD